MAFGFYSSTLCTYTVRVAQAAVVLVEAWSSKLAVLPVSGPSVLIRCRVPHPC